MKENNNLDSIDIAKFILSLLVVSIHIQLFNGKLLPLNRMAVPIFFIFSSYLYFRKLDIKKRRLKKTIKRNTLLYASWFVFLLPITEYIRRYHELGVWGIIHIVRDFFLGSTFLASWYIVAFSLALLFVTNIPYNIHDRWCLIWVVPLYILCLMSSNYGFLFDDIALGYKIFDIVGYPHNNFLIGIVWVSITRYVISRNWFEKKDKLLLAKVLVSLFGLYFEYIVSQFIGNSALCNDCYIMLIPVSLYIAKVVVQCEIHIKYSCLFRELSTVIYCAHFSIYLVLKNVFSMAFDNYNIVIYVFTVAGCLLVYFVLKFAQKVKCLNFLKYSY